MTAVSRSVGGRRDCRPGGHHQRAEGVVSGRPPRRGARRARGDGREARGDRPSTRDRQRLLGGGLPRAGGSLVATMRSEPRTFNPHAGRDFASSLVIGLTQARLLRINRATQQLEPWLAESYSCSTDAPGVHAEAAPRRHLLRRRAVHLGRRRLLVPGGLRREDRQPARRRAARRRQAARRHGARRADGRAHASRRSSARACACSTRCRSCRSTSWRRRSRPARCVSSGARPRRRPTSSASGRS